MTLFYLAQGMVAPQLAQYQSPSVGAEVQSLLDALETMRPQIARYDFDQHEGVPPEILNQLFDLNLFALTIPKAYGGMGASTFEFAQVIAKLADMESALAVTAVPHMGNGVKSVALFGSDAQKELVLRHLCRDRRLISFAITEAHTGSDVASHRTVVKQQDDGGLLLSGSKTWITNAVYAGHVTVVAKCPGMSRIPDGSAFVLVQRDDPGFSITDSWKKMGIAGSPTSDLFLDDMTLPDDRILGEAGKGMAQFLQVVGSGRVGAAAGALGLVYRLRRIIEGAPISKARDQQLHELVLVTASIEAMIALTAYIIDETELDATAITALCKTYATTRAARAIERAYGLFVGHGPITDAMARLMREYPVYRIFEGPNEVLDFRTGLEMVSSLNRNLADGLDLNSLFGGKDLPGKQDLVEGLRAFKTWMDSKRQTRMLMMQQTMLVRASGLAMHILVMLACLLEWDHAELPDRRTWCECVARELDGAVRDCLAEDALPLDDLVAAYGRAHTRQGE